MEEEKEKENLPNDKVFVGFNGTIKEENINKIRDNSFTPIDGKILGLEPK